METLDYPFYEPLKILFGIDIHLHEEGCLDREGKLKKKRRLAKVECWYSDFVCNLFSYLIFFYLYVEELKKKRINTKCMDYFLASKFNIRAMTPYFIHFLGIILKWYFYSSLF